MRFQKLRLNLTVALLTYCLLTGGISLAQTPDAPPKPKATISDVSNSKRLTRKRLTRKHRNRLSYPWLAEESLWIGMATNDLVTWTNHSLE